MAGDLHHYMRHSATQSEKPNFVQHLYIKKDGDLEIFTLAVDKVTD
jgi:hypothetical protein